MQMLPEVIFVTRPRRRRHRRFCSSPPAGRPISRASPRTEKLGYSTDPWLPHSAYQNHLPKHFQGVKFAERIEVLRLRGQAADRLILNVAKEFGDSS